VFYVRLRQTRALPSETTLDTKSIFYSRCPLTGPWRFPTDVNVTPLYQSTRGFETCSQLIHWCLGSCNTAEECSPVTQLLHCYFRNKSTFLNLASQLVWEGKHNLH